MKASGRASTKIWGTYRVDHGGAPWPIADKFSECLVREAPDRLVWGSNWPHPYIDPSPMPDDGDLLNRLLAWISDETVRRKVLVDNPS